MPSSSGGTFHAGQNPVLIKVKSTLNKNLGSNSERTTIYPVEVSQIIILLVQFLLVRIKSNRISSVFKYIQQSF